MDVFTMVAVIVVASCGAGVLNNSLKAKRQREDDLSQSETMAELDELRSRIEVLEQIVTDEKYQLKTELAALERNGDG